MTAPANPGFAEWENFYVIVGSSGAALIGIQFVVVTLIGDMKRRPSRDSLNAFGTPTVVHFAGALVVSALMSVPWHSLWPAALLLASCGLGGIAYGNIVVARARRQTFYRPVGDDWLWYILLPLGSYGLLAAAGLLLCEYLEVASFLVAAGALGLLLAGIHNAWDSVTHIVMTQPRADGEADGPPGDGE